MHHGHCERRSSDWVTGKVVAMSAFVMAVEARRTWHPYPSGRRQWQRQRRHCSRRENGAPATELDWRLNSFIAACFNLSSSSRLRCCCCCCLVRRPVSWENGLSQCVHDHLQRSGGQGDVQRRISCAEDCESVLSSPHPCRCCCCCCCCC